MTGKVVARGDTTHISLAPDARVVAVSVDLSIYVYATVSGDLLLTLDSVHKGGGRSVNHSVDFFR